jgi:hypothetical protein
MLEFCWGVHENGYQWRELYEFATNGRPKLSTKPALYLTYGDPKGQLRPYEPLRQQPALFRIFAEVALDPDAILQFANAHGVLGAPLSVWVTDKKKGLYAGESPNAWLGEIAAMREAVTLWDAAEQADQAVLRRFVHWASSPTRVDYHSDTNLVEIASDDRSPEMLRRFVPGELRSPARHYVQRVANAHLRGRVSAQLLWDETRERMRLYSVPFSLIGALWLQFAQAIEGNEGNKTFRHCQECGSKFEVAQRPGQERAYCSSACQTRASRERKQGEK